MAKQDGVQDGVQQPSKLQKVDNSGMTNVIVQFQSDDGTSTGMQWKLERFWREN